MSDLGLTAIKHIIWDWNGTLLNDLDLCLSIINSMLDKRGMDLISEEQYLEVFTFPVQNYYLEIGFDFEKEPFEDISTEFITAYEAGRPDCLMMSDAKDTLEIIFSSGRTQSILSASKSSYLKKAIIDYNIEKYFNAVKGLDNHHAAGKISLARTYMANSRHDPDQVILIGDTIHDAEIAQDIGVNYVLIPNGHQDRKSLASAGGYLLDSLFDLKALFQRDLKL